MTLTSSTPNGVAVRDEMRPPPQNIRAEQCVLGGLLLSTATLERVRETVRDEDFYRPAHREVFNAIFAVHDRGAPVDPVMVAAELDRRGALIRIGGAPFLLTLMEDTPTGANADYWAEVVADSARRRVVEQTGIRLQQLAHAMAEDVDEVLTRARATLDAAAGAELGRPANGSRLLSGGSFILDAPVDVPAVWGCGDDVLWAAGEPLMITGPTGVGKTTIAGQLVAARLGLTDTVLGFPVKAGRRLLYLAMDRPAQISRALGRVLRAHSREVLDERLVVWKGPPAADLARNPTLLLALAKEAGADTVVIDSLKDAAVKLADEETGQGLNTAVQHCVAEGIEVLELHHQTKRGAGGQGKPNSIADVYGSTWLTAGCGSVLLVWGTAGDLVVEMSHLKQPAGVVGPLHLVHDPAAGTSQVRGSVDVLDAVDETPRTVREVALVLPGTDDRPASDSDIERIRRRLDRFVRDGLLVKIPGPPGSPATYVRAGSEGVTAGVTDDQLGIEVTGS